MKERASPGSSRTDRTVRRSRSLPKLCQFIRQCPPCRTGLHLSLRSGSSGGCWCSAPARARRGSRRWRRARGRGSDRRLCRDERRTRSRWRARSTAPTSPASADHVVSLKRERGGAGARGTAQRLAARRPARIKTTGVHVNDISSFLERETGRVDLDSLNPSWLIFSDGFSSGRRISAAGKSLFDIIVGGGDPAPHRAAGRCFRPAR
jgi:hypothetical protein